MTSEAYFGDLGGLVGADQKCQSAADAAGLKGKFLAWLADGKQAPSDRFPHLVSPYLRVDGKAVADNWQGLQQAKLNLPINLDEYGNVASGSSFVWTGMDAVGVPSSLQNCLAWTSISGQEQGDCGSTTAGRDWQRDAAITCGTEKERLFCFEFVPQQQ